MGNVRDGYTKRAHEWLRLLSAGPNNATGFGNAAYRCRKNNWCDWERDADGRMNHDNREVLTDSGRAKLSDWDAAIAAAKEGDKA